MESSIQSLIESGQEDNGELRTRICVETMSRESHNRVRGYDHGVTPDMMSDASSSVSTSNSSRKSSRSSVALLMTKNNELRSRSKATAKQLADLKAKVQQLQNRQQQMFDQVLMIYMQQFQQRPPHNLGIQQSGQRQPSPTYPYIGQNQQPALYLMYPTPTQPMSFMQQPPMSYMQQSPYQMLVYQPKMPSPVGFYSGVPTGGFSGMLAGVAFDVDLTRAFRSQGGPQEGSDAHSGSGSIQ